MSAFSIFQKTTRAAVAALVISAASISAIPAQAASNDVTFGFSFNSGNGVSFSTGGGNHGHHKKIRPHQPQDICASNRSIQRGLYSNGFHDISFVGERRGKIRVHAIRGRWEYSMRVDRCDGRVSHLKKLRRHSGGHRRNLPHDGAFNLQFNFR